MADMATVGHGGRLTTRLVHEYVFHIVIQSAERARIPPEYMEYIGIQVEYTYLYSILLAYSSGIHVFMFRFPEFMN